MRIEIDKARKVPAYRQIYEQIARKIRIGELLPGDLLPPERKLADILGVNRTTVLNAYRELKADGLLDSKVGHGTFIAENAAEPDSRYAESPKPLYSHLSSGELPWARLFSESSAAFESHLLKDLLTLASRRDIITFATGIASPDSGPSEILRGLENKILVEHELRGLLHAPAEGFLSFRSALCRMMRKRGVEADPEEVVVLSGSQQGIDILARVLVDPGDVVVVEEPTYFPAITAFRAAGARIIGVPLDEDGLRTDILEEILQRNHPKLIYTMPSHQNPTGIDMSMRRRRELLSLAARYRVPILEDDAYGELSYDHEPLPTLKSMDRDGHVIYLSTFSKAVYSGLRIGWMIGHAKLIKRVVSVKQTADLHSSSLSQYLLEPFLDRGFAHHIEKMRVEYREKRDLMCDALERYAPDGVAWNRPVGGYYIWAVLPPGADVALLLRKSAEQGVAFVPGYAFYHDGRATETIRLNFTGASVTEIPEGIRRLCVALRETLDESLPPAAGDNFEVRPIV